MAVAAILKFSLTATTRSLLNTFAQNLAQRLKTTSRRVLPSCFTSEKIQDGGRRHFENWFNGYLSVGMAHICTKFYTGTKNHIPQSILPLKFNSNKIQDGNGRLFEIHFNGHNSVKVKHICTKSGTKTKNNELKTVLPSDFTSEKIQDGIGRHFENWFKGYISDNMAYIA